jgi:hypothetical protein
MRALICCVSYKMRAPTAACNGPRRAIRLAILFASSALASKNFAHCELSHAGAAKNMRPPISPSSTRRRGDANARMDGNRHRGRDWPDLVGRCDVQVGPPRRLGNEVGRNSATC